MVCYIYLSVTFQTDALLDKDVILNNQDKIETVYRQKKWLLVASIAIVLLCLANAAMAVVGFGYIYHKRGPTLMLASEYITVGLIFIFLLIWAIALCQLYSKVKNTDNLLPNKTIFALHGMSLILLVLFSLLSTILEDWSDRLPNEKINEIWRLKGTAQLCYDLSALCEVFGFALVLYITFMDTRAQ